MLFILFNIIAGFYLVGFALIPFKKQYEATGSLEGWQEMAGNTFTDYVTALGFGTWNKWIVMFLSLVLCYLSWFLAAVIISLLMFMLYCVVFNVLQIQTGIDNT